MKQIIVAVGAVVKDRKVLLTKRIDPRPKFNNVWEFPGGGVEGGEEVIAALKREIKEETNLKIEPIEMLPKIYTANRGKRDGDYQVFLVFYFCRIISGKIKLQDAESKEYVWCNIKDLKKMKLIMDLNKIIFKENIKLFKKYID